VSRRKGGGVNAPQDQRRPLLKWLELGNGFDRTKPCFFLLSSSPFNYQTSKDYTDKANDRVRKVEMLPSTLPYIGQRMRSKRHRCNVLLGLIRIKCIRGILRLTVDSSSITSVRNCAILRVRQFEMQHYEARYALNLFAPLSLADIEGACPNWAIHWAGQRVPSRLGVSVP